MDEKTLPSGKSLTEYRLDELKADITKVENSLEGHLEDCKKYRERQDRKMNWGLAFLFTIMVEAFFLILRSLLGG